MCVVGNVFGSVSCLAVCLRCLTCCVLVHAWGMFVAWFVSVWCGLCVSLQLFFHMFCECVFVCLLCFWFVWARSGVCLGHA